MLTVGFDLVWREGLRAQATLLLVRVVGHFHWQGHGHGHCLRAHFCRLSLEHGLEKVGSARDFRRLAISLPLVLVVI